MSLRDSSSLFNEGLKMMGKCPVCHNKFNPISAQILEEKNDNYLVYVRCQHCQSSVIAVITAGMFGVTSIGLITDLNAEEVLKFKNNKSINIDDVINTHQLLQHKQIIKDYIDITLPSVKR